MEEELAYCGLVCSKCQIYLATQESDPRKKMEHRLDVARICNELYGMQYEADDIGNCDGCKTETGRLFSKDCKIKKCATGKGIEICAQCNEYPCDKLDEIFNQDPGARERLDSIKSGL